MNVLYSTMKSRFFLFVWMLIGLAILVFVGIIVFLKFTFGPGPEVPIQLVGASEQRYSIRELPVLGGDGAKMWGVYLSDTQQRIGTITSFEGFREDSPLSYRVSRVNDGPVIDPPLYYKPATKELFVGTPPPGYSGY